jgi:hypothetical protein
MNMATFERSGRYSNKRIAVSALAVAVVVFVAIGIAVEVVFLPKASQTGGGGGTTTLSSGQTASVYCSSGCPTPSTTVQAAVSQWAADFNSRNVVGLGNFYSSNAVVDWTGQASGLAGVYNGVGNIRILYGSSIGKTTTLIANISNLQANAVNPSNYNVTLTLNMNGLSSVVGTLSITVAVNQQWNYVGGSWTIVKETWNYLVFNEQYPVSATTFPQWTAIKEGLNPNLVSEKSFEWHAGPYVAATVYAFLGGIAAIGVIMYRKNRSFRTS